MLLVMVDDETPLIQIMKRIMDEINPNISIILFSDPEQALEYFRANDDYDIVVSDYQMPILNGLSLFKELCSFQTVPMILFTNQPKKELTGDLSDLGIDYLSKNRFSLHRSVLELYLLVLKRFVEHNNLSRRKLLEGYLQSNVPTALYSIPKASIRFVNKSFIDMLGYRTTEILGQQFAKFTHRDDLFISTQPSTKLITQEESVISVKKLYIHKLGFIVSCDVSSAALIFNNEAKYFLTIFQENTQANHLKEVIYQQQLAFDRVVSKVLGSLLNSQKILKASSSVERVEDLNASLKDIEFELQASIDYLLSAGESNKANFIDFGHVKDMLLKLKPRETKLRFLPSPHSFFKGKQSVGNNMFENLFQQLFASKAREIAVSIDFTNDRFVMLIRHDIEDFQLSEERFANDLDYLGWKIHAQDNKTIQILILL